METDSLKHLEHCKEFIEELAEKTIVVTPGRVSIYCGDLEDAEDTYIKLKTILGCDLTEHGPRVIRKLLKEERKEWNRLRKR